MCATPLSRPVWQRTSLTQKPWCSGVMSCSSLSFFVSATSSGLRVIRSRTAQLWGLRWVTLPPCLHESLHATIIDRWHLLGKVAISIMAGLLRLLGCSCDVETRVSRDQANILERGGLYVENSNKPAVLRIQGWGSIKVLHWLTGNLGPMRRSGVMVLSSMICYWGPPTAVGACSCRDSRKCLGNCMQGSLNHGCNSVTRPLAVNCSQNWGGVPVACAIRNSG